MSTNKVYDKTVIKLIEDTEAGKIQWMRVLGGYQTSGLSHWHLCNKDGNKRIEYKNIPLDLSDYDLLTYLDAAIEKSLERKEERRKQDILSELEPKNKRWKFW